MQTDSQIAAGAAMRPIAEIGKRLGVQEDELEFYGRYKAKFSQSLIRRTKSNPDGKLILVTAINPTPAGEGKTTTTVGLGQALNKLGKKAVITLREPSMGPVFGVKGGAAGGGYSQVVPMDEINLHFTGDMHAITAANNLLCALIDNHLQQGNELRLDPRRILFRRCLDMNDRALRNVVVGMGGKNSGVVREEHFDISVASEIMAILCLTEGIADLKERLGRILIGYTFDNTPVFALDLKASGAMAALLRDAIKPNLVQTLENTPAIIHGGPFANIAHGCNSVTATKLALKLADYVVTEAGFGSDLGAEKFFDIKCRSAGLKPSAVVVVATIRALKYNGGAARDVLRTEDITALRAGIVNLGAHVENMQAYGLPVVVAINHFDTDTQAEIAVVEEFCRERGVSCAFSDVFVRGGEGGLALAKAVVAAADEPSDFHPLYDLNLPIEEKIQMVASCIYGAAGVDLSPAARSSIKEICSIGMDKLPICIAKTPYSLSDNPALLGCPTGFTLQVRDVRLSAGAGFVVVLAGSIMTMPGLPAKPAACNIDVDEDGKITGLF